MFQFNFNVENKDVEEGMDCASKTVCLEKEWLQAKHHEITRKHFQALTEETVVEEVTIGNTELKYLSMAPAVEKLKEVETSANIAPVFTDNTDLVPAVYEGGLKIWECSWDLLNYLMSSGVDLKGCRVLELGCGAGLPAIYAMLHGAHVTLQDYNEEVINHITVSNVLLNAIDLNILEDENPITFEETLKGVTSKACFYSGDWKAFDKLITDETNSATGHSENTANQEASVRSTVEDKKFDLILTSETIYNPECHEKLLSLMTNHLKQDGKILLAAKSYYFGVGGGIHQFCDLVKRKGQLDTKNVFTNDIGVKREILEMSLKSR